MHNTDRLEDGAGTMHAQLSCILRHTNIYAFQSCFCKFYVQLINRTTLDFLLCLHLSQSDRLNQLTNQDLEACLQERTKHIYINISFCDGDILPGFMTVEVRCDFFFCISTN